MQLMKDQTKEKKKAKDQAKDPNKPKKPLTSYLLYGYALPLLRCWMDFGDVSHILQL